MNQIRHILAACLVAIFLYFAFTAFTVISSHALVLDPEPSDGEGFCGTNTSMSFIPPGSISPIYTTGKKLFMENCLQCHRVTGGSATAPALAGFQERGPWSDQKKLSAWIRNPSKFLLNEPYAAGLKLQYGYVMTAFPDLSDNDINAIAEYIQVTSGQPQP